MDKYHETDVGLLGAKIGPTINQYFGVKRYEVDFSGGGIDWITDPRLTEDNKTIGQMNREFLHKRLDDFLDRISKV